MASAIEASSSPEISAFANEQNNPDLPLDELTFFMQSGVKNRHIDIGHLRVYVRKSLRFFNGCKLSSLDIGSVEVDDQYQRQGHFRCFLEAFEAIAKIYGFEATLVECVHNPYLAVFLEKAGYQRKDDFLAPTFIKLIRHDAETDRMDQAGRSADGDHDGNACAARVGGSLRIVAVDYDPDQPYTLCAMLPSD